MLEVSVAARSDMKSTSESVTTADRATGWLVRQTVNPRRYSLSGRQAKYRGPRAVMASALASRRPG